MAISSTYANGPQSSSAVQLRPTQGTHACDVSYSKELGKMSAPFLARPIQGVKYQVVRFWVFGPEGFLDREGGKRLGAAKVMLSKGRGYVLVTDSLRGKPIGITALASNRMSVHLDGSATVENTEATLKPDSKCGAILLLGSEKAIVPQAKPLTKPVK